MTWQSLFRVKFSHELFEETLFPLHCLTCIIDTLTSGSSTQVMIVRSQNKSFITGNLHAGKLMCLPTRYTSINTDKYVCVYIYMYLTIDVQRHTYLEKGYTALFHTSHIFAIKYMQVNM